MRRLGFLAVLAALAMVLVACDFTSSDFVTNLPDVPPPSPFTGVGPVGLAFDSAGNLLVSDAENLGFYSIGASGSNAPQPISTGNVQGSLAFAKLESGDAHKVEPRLGQLFGVRYQAGDVNQLDPTTGAILRRLNPPNTTYPCIHGLATDPKSGDLFFSEPNSGGVCPGSTTITRVAHPTSSNPTFTTYINLGSASADGLAFGPDGTLYAIVQLGTSGCATRISGTTMPGPPTATTIACVTGPGDLAGLDSITVSARPRSHPTLYVGGPDGVIRQIEQSTSPPTVTPIVAEPTNENWLAVGPDGCLYATQSTKIEKITNSNGTCSLVPVR
jgi:hypothetical protein